MKKLLSVFLACIVVFLLSGCEDSISSRPGEAKTPSGSTIQEGKDYLDVVKEFEKKGFKNIKTLPIEDLITGWLTKDGEVEFVSVDGDKDYSPDRWYSNDVEVVVAYHTFPSKDEESDSKKEDDEDSTDNITDSPNIEEESIYDKGYRVRFTEYDICYLIDEDDKLISIFSTSDKYTDVYTSEYDGDFNNGINFDWNGLKMRAHYNFVDQDTKLIVYDESGNRNEAIKLTVSMIEGYINLPPNEEDNNSKATRPQKNGFNQDKNINLTLSSYDFQIPVYWNKAYSEEGYYQYYAETNGKTAMLTLTVAEDADEVSFKVLDRDKDDIISEVLDSFNDAEVVEIDYLDKDTYKGILFSFSFSKDGISGDGFMLIFPSEAENKWYTLSMLETDNTEYTYKKDFLKILDKIKNH